MCTTINNLANKALLSSQSANMCGQPPLKSASTKNVTMGIHSLNYISYWWMSADAEFLLVTLDYFESVYYPWDKSERVK